MKKQILCLLTAFVAVSVSAQLVVDESGNTAVGYEGSSSLQSKLSIGSEGFSHSTAVVESTKGHGLYVNHDGTNASYSRYGIYCKSLPSRGFTYALYGRSEAPSQLSTGHAIGVYGSAGNAASGYNYGIFGTLASANNGAAIYGSSTTNDYGQHLTGLYAGYFRGDVYCTGTITGMIANSSDYRLKENIHNLQKSSLEGINKMNVVEFNYKQREAGVDENGNKIFLYEKDSPVLTHKHYGLIAQEVQNLFPNLVYEGTDGYLSVIYTEIVPLLIHAVQELSAKLDLLEAQKSIPHREEGVTELSSKDVILETELFQNDPNPFKEKTIIACTVAESIRSAVLYVYDMQGKQIAEYPVDGRGKTSVTIEGGSLDAGIYLYSLVADGKVVDTKRMILTK